MQVIGRQSVIAAGAVVPMGANIPEGSLVAGVPAKVKKLLLKPSVGTLRTGLKNILR